MKALLALITLSLLFSCSNNNSAPAAENKDDDAPKFIPGLTAADVYGDFVNDKGFAFRKNVTADRCTFTCSFVNVEHVYQVRVLGKNEGSINKVEATVNFPKPGPAIGQFITYVASSISYTGADSIAAGKWATSHVDHGGDTTIGTVRFVLTAASPTARVLSLYAH